jgi:hypothetical protein
MRSTVLILLLSLGVGGVWLAKSHQKENDAPQPPQATAVSEHNWAKHALDRTAEVKRQVAQQRKEDGTR